MTDDEAAIVWTIHTEPNYRFIQNECRDALKMVQKGLLAPTNDRHRFTVTEFGEELYKPHNPSWCRLPKPPGVRDLFQWD